MIYGKRRLKKREADSLMPPIPAPRDIRGFAIPPDR